MAGSRRTAARFTFGAICLSSSSHFALMLYYKSSGIAAWPRQTIDEAGADRVDDLHEDDRHTAGCLSQLGDDRTSNG